MVDFPAISIEVNRDLTLAAIALSVETFNGDH